jgi:hypothetical protein
MVLVMALGTAPVYAVTGDAGDQKVTAANAGIKIVFPDTITHWSQKHVAKLASLGVVKGYNNGNFGSNDPVTQQEVIVMAVRLMGAEKEANNLTDIGTSLQVADWARPHVLYALNKGILLPSEEIINNGYVNWGERSAKREWVAKIIVRALGQQQQAQQLANVPTTFVDNEDITPSMLGYVNAAVKMGIITGTNNNEFFPLRTITRAEIASILSKATQYTPPSDNVIKGYVTAVTNDVLSVRDTNGLVHHIPLTNETAYYRYDQNAQVLKSEVRSGREVYVVTSGADALYVEVTNDEMPTETITGEFVAVDTVKRIIKVVVNGQMIDYDLEETVGVIDPDGYGSSLTQLLPLSIVQLTKNTVTNRIVEITVKEKPLSKSSSGTVVNVGANQIAIRDDVSGAVETYPYQASQIFVTHNEKIIQLSDVGPADTVAYKVVNGYLTEMNITYKYIEPKRGTIVTLTPKTIVIRNYEGKLDAFDIADNVQVQIDGMVAPALKDVYEGDIVTLSFDEKEFVKSIKVENRTISSLFMLTFNSYIPLLNQIVVVDGKDSRILKLTDDTVFEVYGIQYPTSELSKRLTSGQRIDLVLSGDYVQHIKLSDSYTGKVKDLNPTTRKLVLNNPTLGDITLTLSTPTFIQILNQPSITISDLNIGDEVKVILGQDQTTVQQILVKKNVKYTIESVNTMTRLVVLRDSSNGTHQLYISSDMKIEHPSKQYASINDLKSGQTVTVTYYGTLASSINIVESLYGTVESYDRTNQKLVVVTADQQRITIDTDARFELYKGNEKVSANTLLTGDRISFVRDKDGYTFGQVVIREMKTMNRLESGQQISFITILNEIERYTLVDNVIVRSGGRLISLNDLKTRDTLYVYIVNKVIMEIEKL